MKEAIVFATFAMALISFTKRDFTVDTIKKFNVLLLIYISLCLLSYLSRLNNYFGLVINFFTIFVIVFSFVSEIEDQIFYPFIMYYIYMQLSDVSFNELILRLVLTVFGVVIVVGILFFLQRKKVDKREEVIIEIIEKIIDGEEIEEYIEDLTKSIYRERKENFFINTSNRKILNILVILNIIKYLINEENKEYINQDLYNLKEYILGKKALVEISYKDKKYNNLFSYIIKDIDELKKLGKNKKKEYRHNWEKDNFFSIWNILKMNLDIKSLKFSFALRTSVALSLLSFINSEVSASKFSWIMITVMVLLQPYLEDTLLKGIGRLKGTIIGGVSFAIVFNIIDSTIIRVIIICISALIYIKIKEYYKKQIFMTFITVGIASLSISVNLLVPLRIIYIFIGIILAYGISLIIPYKKEKGLNILREKFNENNNLMIIEKEKLDKEDGNIEKIRNLALRGIMIGRKIGDDFLSQAIRNGTEVGEYIMGKFFY